MATRTSSYSPDQVRDDFVPKEVYFDKDFAALEAERLWPHVWQVACREEEVPNVGDFVVYDILKDSIVVVRTAPDRIEAHHNVCPHRGRRLVEGTGNIKQFHCAFHGWRFKLSGENVNVIDRADWGECLKAEDIALSTIQCDTWGGFVFINMDPKAGPLLEFLDPLDEYCGKFEFERLRFRWYKTTIMQSNWKTVLGFFNEFYHVQQAHPQLLEFTNDYSGSLELGRHAQTFYDSKGAVPISRSPRLPARAEPSMLEHIQNLGEQYRRDLQVMLSERNWEVIQTLKDHVSTETPPMEVLAKWGELQLKAAAEEGIEWPPQLTPEYIERSGLAWHVFPNTIFLHGLVDSVLWYRLRPNGDDPESCIFDVWALELFGPGKVPELKRESYNHWEDANFPLIYRQDFVNIPEVQKGFHSRGFKGERTNPVQERAISNFHRVLRRFLEDPYDQPPVTTAR